MTTHRNGDRTKPYTPNWLKAWYASLAFMAVAIFISEMFK